MVDVPIALAFTAGMLATVNPCGFAMLPAYLGYFLGLDDDSPDAFRSVLRALIVALTVAAGFVTVFGVIGFVTAQFSVFINAQLPWVTMVLGLVLAGVGVAMLRGYSPTVSLPKLEKGTGSRALPSMFVFGMSYAIASLSCTIPVFTATISATLTQSSFGGVVIVFLTYAAGMATILAVLTVAVALAKQQFVAGMRRSLPYVQRASGGLLIVAGLFLTYYGWYELQVLGGNLRPAGPGDLALGLQDGFASMIADVGATRLGAAVVVVLTLLLLGLYARGSRRQQP